MQQHDGERRRPVAPVYQNMNDVRVDGGTLNVIGGDVAHMANNSFESSYSKFPNVYHHSTPFNQTFNPTAHNANPGSFPGYMYMGSTVGAQAPTAPPHPSDYFSPTWGGYSPTRSAPPFSSSPSTAAPPTVPLHATPLLLAGAPSPSPSSAPPTPKDKLLEGQESKKEKVVRAERVKFLDSMLSRLGLERTSRKAQRL